MARRPSRSKKYIPPETDDLLQDFYTDLSVGDILRRARLRTGLELTQIAVEIRIRESYLEAIEEGRLEKLPARVYALGFIRTYAEHLGLDGEKIIQLLKKQSSEKVEYKPLGSTLPVDEDHSLPEIRTIVIVALLFFSGLIAYSFFLSFNNTTLETTPSVPVDLKEQVTLLTKPQTPSPMPVQKKTEETPEQQQQEAVVEEETVPAAPPSHPVVLQATDKVWLEIKTGEGKVILSRVLSPGEEYWVPEDQTGLLMTLGNAGGLQILLDGEKLPFLGPRAKVIRGVPLDPDFLKKLKKS